jgi:hypothetical protein
MHWEAVDPPTKEVLPYRAVRTRKRSLSNASTREDHLTTDLAYWIEHGVVINASVTPTLCKPQGKTSYTLEPEGQEPMQRSLQPGIDQATKC